MAWSGFLVGLLGSLHCIAMCGPIALVVGGQGTNNPITKALIYNSGRVVTYTIIGGIMGAIGSLISIAGWQQWLSVGAGVLIIIYVIFDRSSSSLILNSRLYRNFLQRLKDGFGRLAGSRSPFHTLIIGILNGFLPCGLVYVALVGSLGSGSLSGGALYMALFGLGTIPLMILPVLAGRFMSTRVRQRLSALIPVFLVIVGILFILRGMNLGIPYVSPKLVTGEIPTDITDCTAN